jgi:hypothetical protein
MENRRFKEAPVQPTIFEGADYTAAKKRVNETSDIAVSNIFPYVCIRTPILTPDFADASPF